jgi:hypothetical protein
MYYLLEQKRVSELCVNRDDSLWISEIQRLGLCVKDDSLKESDERSQIWGSVWGHEFVGACGWS